jgi:hypothetical protein
LAGERKRYGAAMLHMKEYLELMPSRLIPRRRKIAIIRKDKLNSYFPAVATGDRTPQLKNVSEPGY